MGSVYAIIALGYTMVYGIAKMLNFAHGDVIMIGAYVSFCVTSYMGMPAIVSVLAAVAVCTALGILIEGLAYKPLRQAGPLAVLITAIGVSYFLQNAAQLVWGATPKNFTSIVSFPVPESLKRLQRLGRLARDRGRVPGHHGRSHVVHRKDQDGQGHACLLRG